MKEVFSNQKVHDILEAVQQSLDVHAVPAPFYAIYDGMAYQNGNIKDILGRLYRTFPEQLTELVISDISAKLSEMDQKDIENRLGDDPTADKYWGLEDEAELGVSELDLFKRGAKYSDHSSIDTVQYAVSLCNDQGLIDGDGNILGRDLRRVLQQDFELNGITNFKELDSYLEDRCNGLLSKELVTIGKHSSNGRTRTYNFLNSPFKLY